MEDKMDLGSLTEDDLSSKAVYVVMDRRCHINDTEFAKNSLPPNLILNATSALPDTSIIGVWAKENIPAGTRYSPQSTLHRPPFLMHTIISLCLFDVTLRKTLPTV